MELLRLIDLRIGRWLAYVDSCMTADEAIARCQPFWTLVAVAIGIICFAVLVGVIARIIMDQRRGAGPGVGGKYRRPY